MSTRTLLRLVPPFLRDRLIRRAFHLDELAIGKLDVGLASSEQEHIAAFELLHDTYVKRGIIGEHPTGLRVTPHLLLPSTTVFVAKHAARVVGTLSLVVDSPLGLPMDEIYGAELAHLRAERRRIAEVGALCLTSGFRGTGAMYLLCRIMHDHAQLLGCDDLVIAVHPDVADYYRANILFDVIGPVRAYPGLKKSALAVAMRLDLRTFRARAKQRFGDRALDASNPYWLWFARENPQITLLAPNEVSMRRHVESRRRATLHLAALRPDVIAALDAPDRAYLVQQVPALTRRATTQSEREARPAVTRLASNLPV